MKLKKVLGCLCILMSFSVLNMGGTYAAENYKVEYTKGSDEVYQKTTTYVNKMAIDNNKVSASDIGKTQEKLVSSTITEVYVVETVDAKTNTIINSSLMTNEEVRKLNQLGDKMSRGGGSNGKGKLTIQMNVIDTGNGSYRAEAKATWSGLGGFFDNEFSPSVGDDVIGITWGGEFTGVSKNITASAAGSSSLAKFSLAASSTYAGYAWSFKEYQFDGVSYNYLKSITPTVAIKKTYTANQNKLSSMKLTYIHTYAERSGSVSIDAGGIPSISLSNNDKQWPVEVDCSGIKY